MAQCLWDWQFWLRAAAMESEACRACGEPRPPWRAPSTRPQRRHEEGESDAGRNYTSRQAAEAEGDGDP